MSVAHELGLAPATFRSAASSSPDEDGCRELTVTTDDGVRLAVRDYPSDRSDAATVVLLHGLCLTQQSWDLQIGRLRQKWGNRIRIITYDHRGHGSSTEAPMATYRIDQLASDLADVLAAVNIRSPLTLAGHSMGGMTALTYLARPLAQRPVQPHGLVLVGTAAGHVAERGIGRLLATPATSGLFQLVNHLPRAAADKAVATITKPLGAAMDTLFSSHSAAAAVTAAAVRTTSPATAIGFLADIKRYDVSAALGSIAAKTIVISGGTDMLTPASHSRDMAAAIPGALHLHHPTASHMLLQDAAECVSDAIGRVAGNGHRAGRPGQSRASTAQLAVLVS